MDKVGFEVSGGPQTYSYQYFDLTPVKDKEIFSADWQANPLAIRGSGQFTLWAVGDPWTAGSVTWNSLPRHRTDAAGRKDSSVPGVGQWASVNVKDWVQSWLDPNGWPNYGIAIDTAGADRFVKFGAMDGTGNRPQITVTYNPGPSVSFPQFPGSQVATATPTLTSGTVAGMQYAFRIGTGTDADSGVVATSTLQASPSWTVPAGVLRNGGTYYWKAYTYNGSAWTGSSPKELRLDLHLGASPESPLDVVGPMTVNLATGNVFYRHASPTFQTVGGPLGVSFSYNSQAQPSYGLTGSYYANCDGSQPWEFGRPTTRRHDTGNGSTWNLSWAGAPVAGSVESDAFCVRWKGYLTVPYQASNWRFGVNHDDGARIYLNNEPAPYLDVPSAGSNQYGGLRTIGANQTIPITIDLVDTGGSASIELLYQGPESGTVPLSWLSPSPPVLPTGWNTSLVASTPLAYVSALLDPGDPNLVALVGADGDVSSFVVDASTKAFQPTGLDRSVVAKDEAGNLVVTGIDGLIYTFDAKGKLTSATAAVDRTQPAAPIYVFDPLVGGGDKVVALKDPVSNRQINLLYSTDPFAGGTQCPTKAGFGFDTNAPVGHLCRISYWDGTATNLFYRGGRLAAIEDPGDANPAAADATELTLFNYDGSGRLNMVRDPLAGDKIAEGIYGDDPAIAPNQAIRTLAGYDSQNRVTFVTLPQPAPGIPKPSHTYRYVSAWETQMDVAGLTQPNGFARKVTFSEAGQVETDTDATNRTTTTEWEAGQVIYTQDPAGLRTSRIYDIENGHSERLIKINGPAPSSCFNYDALVSCFTTASVTQTAYDTVAGGLITGLAATYWPNDTLAGAPGGEELYTGTSGGFTSNWGSGQPAALSPTVDRWSARFTGEFLIGSPALVTFRVDGDDGVRLFVDDRMVAERWSCCSTPPAEVTLNLTQYRHRLRVDYRDTGGTASLNVSWKISPDPNFVALPMAATYPAYGLVTQTTDGEGKITRTEYAAPERGLPTATVVDPSGLNLRTETDYNDTYFRRSARRLPKHAGAGPATTYAYYGAGINSVNADDPCTVPVESIHQGGAVWKTTDTATIPVIREFVYDARGQVLASRIGTGPWECTTYDQRGRVLTSKDSAGKTTGFDYTTAGVTKVTNDTAAPSVYTTSEVDLVYRPVAYRDEHGTTTKTVYDQPGRVTETRRAFPGQTERLLTTHEYDAAGRPTAMVDYNDRLLDTEPGQARRSVFTYDTFGRLATTTAPNGIVTTKTYDDAHGGALGTLSVKRNTTELSPWSYAYNRAGKITSETTTIGGGQRVRNFSYDNAWRLVQTGEGAATRYYRYDKNSNRCSTSSTITDCSDTAYEYDNADRLTTATTDPRYANLKYDADPVTGLPLPVAHGNLTHMGTTVVTYDARDHLTTITDGTNKVQETLAPSGRVLERKVTEVATGNVTEWKLFGYDGPGDSPAYEQTTSASGPNWSNPLLFSEDWTQVWKPEKWVTSTSGTASLGINGNRGEFYVSGGSDARAMAITPATADSEVALSFEFSDLANRSGFRIGQRGCSAQPTCPGPSMNFGYRVDIVSDQSTVSVRRIVNGSHTTLPGGTFSYTKTAGQKYRVRVRLQGYTISVKLWKAGDPEPANWSLVVTDNDTVNRIGGTGKLHLHHNGTAGTRSVYVDDLVYTDFSRVRTTYLGGPGGLNVIDTNGEPVYAHANGHGDIAGTTDIAGAYNATAAVDEYGKGTPPASRLGWLGTQQRFTAHTGNSLMRMGVRLYDPNIGRFLSIDPVEGGSANNYDYAYADPVNQFDLDGECVQLWRKKCRDRQADRLKGAAVTGARATVAVHRAFKTVQRKTVAALVAVNVGAYAGMMIQSQFIFGGTAIGGAVGGPPGMAIGAVVGFVVGGAIGTGAGFYVGRGVYRRLD